MLMNYTLSNHMLMNLANLIYFFNKSRAFKKNRKYQNGIFSILF